MKEIPEYQKNTAIQSTGKARFDSAYETRKTHKADKIDFVEPNKHKIETAMSWANFGANLAQRSANKRAELSAIEAAQTPGRTQLFPEITETDKHFNETYKQEELQVVSGQANSLMQKLYADAEKVPNPNMAMLNTFEKNAMQANQKFLEQLTPENRPKMERALKSAYEANYAQLVLKMDKYNKKVLDAQSNKAVDQNIRDSQKYNLLGNHEAAKEAYERTIGAINGREARGQDMPDVAEKKRQAAYEGYQTSHYQKKMEEAIQEGKGNEFLQKLRTDPPEHLDPITRESVISSCMQYSNQYNAALTGQQNLEYLNYQKAMVQGTLTPTMMAEAVERMGPERTAKIELQIAKANSENNDLNILSAKMVPIFDKPDMMSQFKPDEVNKVYKQQVAQQEQNRGYQPGTMPLVEQAQIAQGIQKAIPDLTNKIETRLKGLDPGAAAEAASIVQALEVNNKLALSGLSQQARSLAEDIGTSIEQGMDPVAAVDFVKHNTIGLDNKGIEERENKFKTLTQGSKAGSRDFNDPNKADRFVANSLGISKSAIPVGVTSKYISTLKNNFINKGDWNLAVSATNKLFERSYGESTINGKSEYMYAPPEKFVPLGVNAQNLIRNQALDLFQNVTSSSKEMYDKKGMNFYYEVDKKSLSIPQSEIRSKSILGDFQSEELSTESQDSESKPNFRGDRIKIKQIWRNGDIKEGYLVISADRKTTIPEEGTMPNYWIGVEINGMKEGVLDPKTNQNIRIQPNVSAYVEKQNKLLAEEQEKAREKGRRHPETRKQIAERVKELKENPFSSIEGYPSE